MQDLPTIGKCNTRETGLNRAAFEHQFVVDDSVQKSLLGIFGVNMPMLYGEGTRAFVRLQQEIIKSSTDQSILTWTGHNKSSEPEEAPEPTAAGILATSPADFTNCRRISYQGDIAVYQSYDLTNAGLRMTLPMVKYGTISWGILNCKQDGNLLGIQLEPIPAPQLPESMKRRTSDIKAYSIVPIRNNSHVKFMGHWDISQAHWKDILIVGRTASPQQPGDPRPLVGLRFISRDTYNSKTHFQIISMMPSGLWDRLNMVQPSLHGDRIAVPFIPVTDIAMGGIVFEDRSTRQRLAVYFRYEAAPQSIAFNPYNSFFVSMSALPASSKEFSMTWEEFCRTYLLAEAPETPNPPRPQISTSPKGIELTESTVELEGNIRMAAYLRDLGKAGELELVFEEVYDPDHLKQMKRMFKRKGSSTKD